MKELYKVGDWVQDKVEVYFIKQYIKELELYECIDKYDNPQLKDAECISLWKPTSGEWCVFWDNNTNSHIVAKYGETLTSSDTKATEDYWDNVAPLEFITTLKDKQ